MLTGEKIPFTTDAGRATASRLAAAITIALAERRLECLPVYLPAEGEERMPVVERVREAEEETLLRVGGVRLEYVVPSMVCLNLQGSARYYTKPCRFIPHLLCVLL